MIFPHNMLCINGFRNKVQVADVASEGGEARKLAGRVHLGGEVGLGHAQLGVIVPHMLIVSLSFIMHFCLNRGGEGAFTKITEQRLASGHELFRHLDVPKSCPTQMVCCRLRTEKFMGQSLSFNSCKASSDWLRSLVADWLRRQLIAHWLLLSRILAADWLT